MSRFDEAFDILMEHEGGYVNDPVDPGGETNWGISKRQYPDLDIKGLTRDEAKAIYKRDYWDKLMLHVVENKETALQIFDMVVNMGLDEVLLVQKAVNSIIMKERIIKEDGVMGPKTLGALNFIETNGHSDSLVKLIKNFRINKYITIVEKDPSMGRFLIGWLRRVR